MTGSDVYCQHGVPLDMECGDCFYDDMGPSPEEPLKPFPPLRVSDAFEVRATDPETGAQKGRKSLGFDMLPVRSLEEITKVYDYGAKKYSRHNWRGGYAWSWSFAALMRHLWAFWRGEDKDSESGLLHLAHAGFHVLALLEFSRSHPEKDDRFKEI